MKLYAICYGKNFKYGTAGTVYRDAGNANVPIEKFSFFYYLVKYEGKCFLVDTGFRDETLAADMEVTLFSVKQEIKTIFGGDIGIDTIFLTHSHWDHINNLDLYKPMQIIMSEASYKHAMEEGTEQVKHSLEQGTITLVKRKYLAADKFLFRVVGGHTPDSSAIFFEEAGKKYVITGDECYLRDNIYKKIPIGICHDPRKNEVFVRFCHEKKYIPLPFHDGGILDDYKRVSEHIVRIL